MKRVQSREELKHKVLLTLGHPYIQVNVSAEHLDLAIDNAMRQFFKHSIYGSFESHYAVTTTAEDVSRNYISVPRNIDAVVEVIPKGMSISDLSFMTAEYQMTRETFMAAQRFNNVSLVDFVTLKQRLYHTQQIISAPLSFEFIRYQRRLIPLFTFRENQVIVFRCYENVDPESEDVGVDPSMAIDASDLWDDDNLLKLSVAETKVIWGTILKKFGNVVLPGGITLDGSRINDEGKSEIREVIDEMLHGNPIDFSMG